MSPTLSKFTPLSRQTWLSLPCYLSPQLWQIPICWPTGYSPFSKSWMLLLDSFTLLSLCLLSVNASTCFYLSNKSNQKYQLKYTKLPSTLLKATSQAKGTNINQIFLFAPARSFCSLILLSPSPKPLSRILSRADLSSEISYPINTLPSGRSLKTHLLWLSYPNSTYQFKFLHQLIPA